MSDGRQPRIITRGWNQVPFQKTAEQLGSSQSGKLYQQLHLEHETIQPPTDPKRQSYYTQECIDFKLNGPSVVFAATL